MLIGLTGYAQHGKDTVGRYLVEKYGFTRYAFADQLKSMALALNPYIPDQPFANRLYTVVHDQGWEAAKTAPEIRRFLQVLGTEAVRDHLGEDAWIDALKKAARDNGDWDQQGPAYRAKIVVTDVRFPNEARFIKESGGKLWRIKRLEKLESGKCVAFDNGLGTKHPSEQYIRSLRPDSTLIACTVEELAIEVDELMRRSA